MQDQVEQHPSMAFPMCKTWGNQAQASQTSKIFRTSRMVVINCPSPTRVSPSRICKTRDPSQANPPRRQDLCSQRPKPTLNASSSILPRTSQLENCHFSLHPRPSLRHNQACPKMAFNHINLKPLNPNKVCLVLNAKSRTRCRWGTVEKAR